MVKILVTGASSGLGLTLARDLARTPGNEVVVGCRTEAKVQATIADVMEGGGTNGSSVAGIALDLGQNYAALVSAVEKQASDTKFGALVFNAGAVYAKQDKNEVGHDSAYAGKLVGHHVVLNALMEQGKLEEKAIVIIVGSEIARGDITGMPTQNFDRICKQKFNGDFEEMFTRAIQGDPAVLGKFDGFKSYQLVSAMQVWYCAELSKRYPELKVVVVSPGSVMSTNAARHMNPVMKFAMKRILPLVLGSQSKEVAIKRFTQVLESPEKFESGKYYASPPKKVVGKLVIQSSPEVSEKKSGSIMNVVNKLAKVGA